MNKHLFALLLSLPSICLAADENLDALFGSDSENDSSSAASSSHLAAPKPQRFRHQRNRSLSTPVLPSPMPSPDPMAEYARLTGFNPQKTKEEDELFRLIDDISLQREKPDHAQSTRLTLHALQVLLSQSHKQTEQYEQQKLLFRKLTTLVSTFDSMEKSLQRIAAKADIAEDKEAAINLEFLNLRTQITSLEAMMKSNLEYYTKLSMDTHAKVGKTLTSASAPTIAATSSTQGEKRKSGGLLRRVISPPSLPRFSRENSKDK